MLGGGIPDEGKESPEMLVNFTSLGHRWPGCAAIHAQLTCMPGQKLAIGTLT